jgi:spermidine synthase
VTGSGWKGAAPAALLGFSLGVSSQVAAGLLLYGGPGFIPALAVILAVIFLSLGAGLAALPPLGTGERMIEEARRRWLITLLAFTMAAAFAAGWEIFRGFGALGITQAVGLAVLAALPAYTGGRTLGMLAHLSGVEGSRGPAFPALAGASSGALVLAYILFPALSPTAVILICLLAVSAGALVHGLALDDGVRVEPLPGWEGGGGRLEVERWIQASSRQIRVAVREDGRLRLLRWSDGAPVLPEERAVEGDVLRWGPAPKRVLALGLGAGVMGGRLAAPTGGVELTIVDTVPERLERLLRALEWGRVDRVRRLVEDPGVFLQRGVGSLAPGGADWIVVDALALGATGASARIPPGGFLRLRELLSPDGVLVVLPLEEGEGAESLMERFQGAGKVFPRAALYLGPQGGEEVAAAPPSGGWPRFPLAPGARRGFLVAARSPGTGWPESVEGFLRVTVGN